MFQPACGRGLACDLLAATLGELDRARLPALQATQSAERDRSGILAALQFFARQLARYGIDEVGRHLIDIWFARP